MARADVEKDDVVDFILTYFCFAIKEKRKAKKMREKRGEEIKEKQRIYAKNHREKLKKERENATANEEGLKQAASNGAVTLSDSANTQPNEVPDTVPASGAAHVPEVAEAMALDKAEEKRLQKKEQNKNHREKLKKELEDAMDALKQAASNAAACHTSKELEAPGAAKALGRSASLKPRSRSRRSKLGISTRPWEATGCQKRPSSPTRKSQARTSQTSRTATW